MKKFLVAALVATAALVLGASPALATGGGGGGVIKVTICHKPGTPAQKTKSVPLQALFGHLGHGDYLGACRPLPPQEEEPPVITPPVVTTQINRGGVCVWLANGGSFFLNVTPEEAELMVASGTAIYALVDANGAISCDFPNTVVVEEAVPAPAPVVKKKAPKKPVVKIVKTKPPVVKVVKKAPAPKPVPRPSELPFTL